MGQKKQKGEKYDAWLLKDVDPMQDFMTGLLGNRADNEAVCKFDVEMAPLIDYVNRKNEAGPDFKYTFYHVFCAALVRTIADRPRMNYFIRNNHYYERKWISISTVVKKQKKDGAEEGLLIIKYDKESDKSPLEQLYTKIRAQVMEIRKSKDSMDDTTKIMKKITSLPGPIYKLVIKAILRMDRKGNLFKEFADASPYSQTCFISNLGSIKMDADYHHLSNFGSNSLFAIIGRKEKKPVYDDDGTVTMKEFLPVSFTIDERIADGVYFNNSIKVLKAYLLKPELLDLPAKEKIDIRAVEEELGLL